MMPRKRKPERPFCYFDSFPEVIRLAVLIRPLPAIAAQRR
jgi:hypothetical protein